MKIVPMISLRAANDFVMAHHRHLGRKSSHIFSIGLEDDDGVLRGVCIVSPPCSRSWYGKRYAEVSRLAVEEGVPNGCSQLYGAVTRICREMGFNRLQTYLMENEDGASVKASGFHFKHWTTHNDRKSDPSHKAQDDRGIKQLWIKNFRVGSITWEVEDAFGQAA